MKRRYRMKITEYVERYNLIARILMEHFTKIKKGENIVLSPMSVIILLGMLADAVAGRTRDEIVKIIENNSSYDELMSLLAQIQKTVSDGGSLMSSSAVCVKDDISSFINEGYEEHLKEIFDGKLFTSGNIVKDMDIWLKEKTNGMIENATDESMNQMFASLINAIAFESKWMENYEEDDIHEGNFNNANGTISEVQMLESSEDMYIEDDFFTGFVKPYKNENYAFMALLPKRKKSASFILRALKQIDFSKLFREATYETVYVTMPEFKCDFGENLIDFCRRLGIHTLFTPEADFSPMSSEWMKVDSIMHKAHIEVDRCGTKAAVVTMAYVVAGCSPNIHFKSVYLDRPFVYAIMNTEMGLPVFTGIYNQVETK